jgi:hypothetical protein
VPDFDLVDQVVPAQVQLVALQNAGGPVDEFPGRTGSRIGVSVAVRADIVVGKRGVGIHPCARGQVLVDVGGFDARSIGVIGVGIVDAVVAAVHGDEAVLAVISKGERDAIPGACGGVAISVIGVRITIITRSGVVVAAIISVTQSAARADPPAGCLVDRCLVCSGDVFVRQAVKIIVSEDAHLAVLMIIDGKNHQPIEQASHGSSHPMTKPVQSKRCNRMLID